MQKFLILLASIHIFLYPLISVAQQNEHDEREPQICNETSKYNLINILAIKGGYINLDCSEVCLKSPALWYRASASIASLVIVDYKNEEKIKTNWQEYSIVIKNLTEEDEGHYFCSRNGSFFNEYILDVVDEEPLDILLYPIITTIEEPITWKLVDNKGRNISLSIAYRWFNWSECSRCNQIGLRKIIGLYCVTTANMIDGSPYVDTERAYLLWQLLNMGLSTRSYMIPEWISNDTTFQENQYRKSKVVYKFCKVDCSNDTSDDFGDIKNKKLSDLVPITRKETVSHLPGSNVVLGCPDLKLGNDSVVWKKGPRIIDLLQVPFTTGRKYADHLGQFRINNVQTSDEGIYSCRLPHRNGSDRNVATNRLVVGTVISVKQVDFASLVIYSSFILFIVIYMAKSIIRNRKHVIG